MPHNQPSRGFILDTLAAFFNWFRSDERTTLYMIIGVLVVVIIYIKDSERQLTERMYERLIKDMKKEVAPLKDKQDSVAATVDTTTNKIERIIDRLDKKIDNLDN